MKLKKSKTQITSIKIGSSFLIGFLLGIILVLYLLNHPKTSIKLNKEAIALEKEIETILRNDTYLKSELPTSFSTLEFGVYSPLLEGKGIENTRLEYRRNVITQKKIDSFDTISNTKIQIFSWKNEGTIKDAPRIPNYYWDQYSRAKPFGILEKTSSFTNTHGIKMYWDEDTYGWGDGGSGGILYSLVFTNPAPPDGSPTTLKITAQPTNINGDIETKMKAVLRKVANTFTFNKF